MKKPAYPIFDPTATCPKCGCDDIGVAYHGDTSDCCYDEPYWGTQEPHLLRRCAWCGYQWPEASLDRVGWGSGMSEQHGTTCVVCDGDGYYVPACLVKPGEPMGTRHSRINCPACNPDCVPASVVIRRGRRRQWGEYSDPEGCA